MPRLSDIGAGSKAFISNAELGLYPDPPERIFSALNTEYGYLDYLEVVEEYHTWQSAVRKYNYGFLKPGWLDPYISRYDPRTDGHPFAAWRAFSGIDSRVRPAKLYCVSPSILSRFELQPWKIASVPPILMAALRDAGYSSEMLATLEKRWVDYKQHLSQGVGHTSALPR